MESSSGGKEKKTMGIWKLFAWKACEIKMRRLEGLFVCVYKVVRNSGSENMFLYFSETVGYNACSCSLMFAELFGLRNNSVINVPGV